MQIVSTIMNANNKLTAIFSAVATAAAILLGQSLAPKSEVRAAVPATSPVYKIVQISELYDDNDLQLLLNENATDGWHLKQIIKNNKNVAIFER